jgi:tetratricopeptide (TPR) repeat protein
MLYILITFTLLFSDHAGLRQAGLTEFRAGHYAQAEVLMRTALESAHSNHDEYEEALSYSDLGDDLQAQSRLLEAERAYVKALSIFGQQPGYAHAAAIVLRSLASDLTAQLKYREARAALKEATKLISKCKVQDPGLSAAVMNSLGVIQFDEGEIDKAESSFSRAASLPFDGSWEVRSNMGHVYQIKRQYVKAEEAYSTSLRLAGDRPGRLSLAIIHDNLGSLYMDMGRGSEAEGQFRESLALLESLDMSSNPMPMAHTLYQLARTRLAQNDEAHAQAFLARAAAMARKNGNAADMPEIAEILDVYAKVLKDSSNASDADHVQTEARRIRAGMAFTVPLANLH